MPAVNQRTVNPALLSKARSAAERLRPSPTGKRPKDVKLNLTGSASDVQALIDLVDALSGRSGPVEAAVIDEEMTPNQAALALGMSRPSVMRLVAKGELHPRMVHTRHKFSRAEIEALARKQTKTRREALANLTALAEDFDF